MIRVRVVREYDLTVAELFPDGIPDPPRGMLWPDEWPDERRAAFIFNDQAERNPFAESSFAKDFETECDRSHLYATLIGGTDA